MFAWSQGLRSQPERPIIPSSTASCCCCNYGNMSFKLAFSLLFIVGCIFATIELIDGICIVSNFITTETTVDYQTLYIGIPQIIIESLRIISLFYLLTVHQNAETTNTNTNLILIGFFRFMILFSLLVILFRYVYIGNEGLLTGVIGPWIIFDLLFSIHTLCTVNSYQKYIEWSKNNPGSGEDMSRNQSGRNQINKKYLNEMNDDGDV